ncbi:hypothetical protein TVAG_284170 [Trichomonas vaginalis G3]|uniref:RanBD1 domain-containing protein n=1 Tax=Trichomonas vaginalis (strain ATCC PRA-98 / G3) TaxID=412133 RepID=A2FF80_TRIV3|nr:Ran-specific GTPase-activating protein family [Trichomonas vaginalis G3]EAX96447.1 hypothetical protein TVAG_284170 [Trichomonas vaginalis G3]KAI5482835.1 Ran-specific GTPase-activating protein family [Trichomonas vaginalis G3]|eukprot:XP_001309377.1 hypothetical protein [Trichomonas vaginalis G3]
MGDKIEEALNLFNSMGYDSDQEIIITVLVIIIFSPTEKVGGKFRILKNKENGRYRVLFRDNHERVLLNHYVNPDIQFNYKEGEQKGVKYHVIEYETYDFAQLTENQEPKKVKITVTSPPSKPEYTENLYTALLDAQKKNAALLGIKN